MEPLSTSTMEGTPLPSAATGTGNLVLGLPIQGRIEGLTFSHFNLYYGARVTTVAPTSAYKDKFEEGDCIVMIDGQRIKENADINKNSHKRRIFRIVKKDGQCCVETCRKKANRYCLGLCGSHAKGQCSHTDEEGGRCPNNTVIRGLCRSHSKGQCSHTDEEGGRCTNNAVIRGLCWPHAKGQCSFDIDGKGTKCPNNALIDGLCMSHGDLCRCKQRLGKLRCIRRNKSGLDGFCRVCSEDVDAKRQATMGDCDPVSVLLERMDTEIMAAFRPFMSPSQIKVMDTVHELRKKLMNNPFQVESFSVNKKLSELVRELMQEVIADDKYQNLPLRCSDNITFKTLTAYLHMTLLQVFKAALKDFGDGGIVYKGKMSKEHVNEIIDDTIRLLKDNSCPDEGGMFITKAGSGGNMGPIGLASDRRVDNALYPASLFDRNKFVALDKLLSSDERGLTERLTAITLQGLGIGCNINLPGEAVPDTPNNATSRVYLIPSTATSIAKHLADYAMAVKGQNAPPGYVIVPAPQPSPTSTTASNTTGNTGGITYVADPTPADSVQPNQPVSSDEEKVPMPTAEHETPTHPRKDETDDKDDVVEFSAQVLHDDDCEGEGERERDSASPVTVAQDISKITSETCVPISNESAVNDNETRRKRNPENLIVDGIESPPKVQRQHIQHTAIVSNQQLSNPPGNSQDHLAIAQAWAINQQNATLNYTRRLGRRLMDEGELNLQTLKENKDVIEMVAENRVTDSTFVPYGMSQVDCDLIKRDLR